MSRLTFLAFMMLTGFFYITGKPADESDNQVNRFAGTMRQDFAPAGKVGGLRAPVTQQASGPTDAVPGRMVLPVSRKKNVAQSKMDVAELFPLLPSRNPRRSKTSITHNASDYGIRTAALAVPASYNRIKVSSNPKPIKAFSFDDIKSSSTAIKPLAVSYRQRYVKIKRPVLGPRLTAILIKRELRRVGCYKGTITSKWDSGVKNAIQDFNLHTNSNLIAASPNADSLQRMQQITRMVCPQEPVAARTIVASIGKKKRKVKGKRHAFHGRKWPPAKTAVRPTRKLTAPVFRSASTSPLALNRGTKARYNDAVQKPAFVKSARSARKVRARRRNFRAIAARRRARLRFARRTIQRRTAVRGWRRTYRRRRFGFRRVRRAGGIDFSLD